MRSRGWAALALMLVGLPSAAAAEAESAERPRAMLVRNKGRLPRVVDGKRIPSEHEQTGERPISLGMLLGYGISRENGPVNPWGVGFGAGGGYNLGDVFLGARFVFYVGEEPSSVWELGLEGGYDLRAGVFTARPSVGFGLASLSLEAGPTSMESETEPYLAPGLTLLFDVASDVFAGIDGRWQLMFADPRRDAVIVLGNVGMRF